MEKIIIPLGCQKTAGYEPDKARKNCMMMPKSDMSGVIF